MPRRFAAHAAITAALGLALYGATALPALAATSAPVPGTAACDTAVKNDPAVTAAKDKLKTDKGLLATAQNTLAADQNKLAAATVATDIAALKVTVKDDKGAVTAAQDTVTEDQQAVTDAESAATKALCTGTPTSTTGATSTTGSTSSTTPAPSTSPAVVPHTRSVAFLDGEIDALSCGSSNADLQTIDRQIAARQAAHQTTDEVNSRLNAKIASLNCTGTSAVTPKAAAQAAKDCGCDTTTTAESQAPQSSTVVTYKTVVPTQSDGSVATTSGNEVTDVPAGSAQTGSV